MRRVMITLHRILHRDSFLCATATVTVQSHACPVLNACEVQGGATLHGFTTLIIGIWSTCAAATGTTGDSLRLLVSHVHLDLLIGSLSLTGWRAETVVIIAAICVGIRIENSSRDLLRRVHDDRCAALLDQPLILELLDSDDRAIGDCFLGR